MHRSIMDRALMISAAIRHAIDHHGKTEVVALAIEDDIHRCVHALTALARTQQQANVLPRLGVQPGSSLLSRACNTRRGLFPSRLHDLSDLGTRGTCRRLCAAGCSDRRATPCRVLASTTHDRDQSAAVTRPFHAFRLKPKRRPLQKTA